MPHFEVYLKLRLHPGAREALIAIIDRSFAALKTPPLRYDWFLQDEKNEAVAFTAYPQDASLDALAETCRELSAISEITMEVLGAPKSAAPLAPFHPAHFTFGAGLAETSTILPPPESIQVYTKFHIHPGEAENFQRIALQLLDIVKEKDAGTPRYDSFYNPDLTECVLMDTYADTNGMYSHMRHCAKVHHELTDRSTMTVEFLGLPPPAAMKGIASFNPYILIFHRGLAQA